MESGPESYVTIKVSQHVYRSLKRMAKRLKARNINELLEWMVADWEYGGGSEVEQ